MATTLEAHSAKLHDYFAAGARLVWYISPRERAVQVYRTSHGRQPYDDHAR